MPCRPGIQYEGGVVTAFGGGWGGLDGALFLQAAPSHHTITAEDGTRDMPVAHSHTPSYP